MDTAFTLTLHELQHSVLIYNVNILLVCQTKYVSAVCKRFCLHENITQIIHREHATEKANTDV